MVVKRERSAASSSSLSSASSSGAVYYWMRDMGGSAVISARTSSHSYSSFSSETGSGVARRFHRIPSRSPTSEFGSPTLDRHCHTLSRPPPCLGIPSSCGFLALESRSAIRSLHPSMASLLSTTRSQPLCFPVNGGCDSDGWFPSSLRFGFDRRFGNGKKTRHVGSPPPSVASPTMCGQKRDPLSDPNLKILRLAREMFTQEISFRSEDKDVSLAKALLLVASEDEAFMSFNRDMDAYSFLNERKGATGQFKDQSEVNRVEDISLAGKSISGWLNELDMIAKEVEAELVSREIGCHLFEVLEAVNVVLFESRGFKRFPILVDSKFSYLHTVLSSGCGSAIMFSVIYIEVCRRLGVTVVGSRVGEDFLIWPQSGNPVELFRTSSGHSLFATINGRCVKDPRSKASELDSSSLLRLEIATNREIIGIALASLIRLHWKRASKANHGLLLTSPLRPVHPGKDNAGMGETSKIPLLRPQELRLAIMASERRLILQPDNWTLRRDHGMLLYHSRRYGEAVQELSICMAFAPEEEAEILEPFVEKLHLLRLLSSWECLEQAGSVPVP